MLPILVRLGPVPIYSFGVMLVVAIIMGMYVIYKKIDEYHFEVDMFFDFCFLTLLWGLLGARLAYIVEHFAEFSFNLLRWVWLTNYSGMSIWGAIVAGGLVLVWLAYRRGLKVMEVLDLAAIGTALGLAIGRIGSFLDGSSVGSVNNGPLGIMMAGLMEKRLPIQLFEAGLFLVLFIFLWKAEKKYRMFEWYRGGKSSAKPGFLVAGFLIATGLIWLVTSFFKAEVFWWGNIAVGRLIYGVMTIFGLGVLYNQSGVEIKQVNEITKKWNLKMKRSKMGGSSEAKGNYVGKDWVRKNF